jgi:hypothetical protein
MSVFEIIAWIAAGLVSSIGTGALLVLWSTPK